ncbi:phosphate/phosphite/phosphonate ABC transporter substrate-binding protein [Lutibacter sp.]|uniref:substrate-binding domain-containing protein n=1 Tax=Lutibacter sp. TaxID=1925666 RepID=UPI002734FD69|nr:phosphate/phosphite/phosphonate ABC transporter substrate-binding protein [Lutibacter sp.]MDP3314164.1 phosphate/phosphite/phosphonate ABC transporter substrate-binding protein [Lutibacter sp.]
MKLIVYLAMFLLFLGCNYSKQRDTKTTEIDFLKTKPNHLTSSPGETEKLKVAVSAIITPRETLNYYKDLLNYITKELNYEIEFKQRKTYEEVNELLFKNEVDLAFICSGAYVIEKDKNNIELLVVPISNGKPFYQAYIIVHESSKITSFEELKGKSFTYTDPMSNTGKLYALKRIKDLGQNEDAYFKSTMYSNAHDNSMQLVAKKIVEGATIDGLIYDYAAKYYPEKVKGIKIIEKSENFGIPPIVVPTELDAITKQKLKKIFLEIHQDSVGKKILDKLMIDRFEEGKDENYNSIRKNYVYTKQ